MLCPSPAHRARIVHRKRRLAWHALTMVLQEKALFPGSQFDVRIPALPKDEEDVSRERVAQLKGKAPPTVTEPSTRNCSTPLPATFFALGIMVAPASNPKP